MKKWLILLLFSIFSLHFSWLFLDFDFALSQSEVVISARIASICDNGLVEFDEACDDGANNGNYGYCNADCSGLGIRCGDGIVQAGQGEECDDGNDVSNDGCSASCKWDDIIIRDTGVGGLPPPSAAVRETKVVFIGSAWPWAEITVLQNGKIRRVISLNEVSDFEIELIDLIPGVYNFGLRAKDKQARDSAIFPLTVTVFSQMITAVRDILMPPTIGLEKANLLYGETLNVLGAAAPQSKVRVFVDGKIVGESTAETNGSWLFIFNTSVLTKGAHNIKVMAQTEQGLSSSFSKIITWHLEEKPLELTCPGADLNKDGRVDIIDFSILLFWWGQDNICADQNQDGIVDLIDFSIMMYYWTG